jgi:hypothetical protein
MPTEKPRFSLTVDEELDSAIRDYQFSSRAKNKTQAVVELIEMGIERLEAKFAEAEKLKNEIEEEYSATYNLGAALKKEKPSAFGGAKGDEVTVDEMRQLLCNLGYIRPGEDLRAEDLDFMTHLFGMLDAWFASRNTL